VQCVVGNVIPRRFVTKYCDRRDSSVWWCANAGSRVVPTDVMESSMRARKWQHSSCLFVSEVFDSSCYLLALFCDQNTFECLSNIALIFIIKFC